MTPITQLAILGLGLMGGSFALAARRAGLASFIIGYDPQRDVMVRAVTDGVIEQAASDPHDAVRDADVVVLAAPVRAILQLLDEIAPCLRPGTLVLDLGSTKRDIVARMSTLPPHVRAVGGHPMCGKEVAGLHHAEAALFENAPFALCVTDRTDAVARATAETIARALGARPLWLDAAQHDTAVALVSHLPYLMSVALVAAALETEDAAPAQLASSGFRDTSRLAASNSTMMLDILLTNREAVLNAIENAMHALRTLSALLAVEDEAALHARLEALAALRRAWAENQHP
ncbi:MAG: prephenate dehydrogenase [Ardenticatenia bacterium]|nr:MAG: prephenate dehydrogenase [Ardenticatenia bacterium]